MKTRAVASPSTAGGRSLDQSRRNPARSVETLVYGCKLETCIGALLAGQRLAFIDQPEPADQILLTCLGLLTRFIDTQFISCISPGAPSLLSY